MNDDWNRAVGRRLFYDLVQRDEQDWSLRKRAMRLAGRLLATAEDETDLIRWAKWIEVLRTPNRIGFLRTADMIAGDDLEALNELRAAETPADLVGETS